MTIKERMMEDTQYFPVYKFLLDLGIAEAMILSILIDMDSFASNRAFDDNTFFKCTDNFLLSIGNLNITAPTIKKYFDKFVNQGYIQVRIINHQNTNCRYVKINQDKLIKKYSDYMKSR